MHASHDLELIKMDPPDPIDVNADPLDDETFVPHDDLADSQVKLTFRNAKSPEGTESGPPGNLLTIKNWWKHTTNFIKGD